MSSIDLAEVFPWVCFLPPEAVAELRAEIVSVLQEGAVSDTPLGARIASWQSTAEVYADPELAKRLRTPTGGDFGPAAPPAP